MEPEISPAPGEKHLKQIRTFEGDLAEAIQGQGESLNTIRQAEVNRRESVGGRDLDEPRSTMPLVYAILTLVLLTAGGLGARYAYVTYKEKTAPVALKTPVNQLVKANTLVNIDASTISRRALLTAIAKETRQSRGQAEIWQIELRRGTLPDSELLSSADFLTRLGSHAPSSLVRALNPTFMLGVLGESHAFMLIRLDSFASAFPGMLDWEPRLAEDILPLFEIGEVKADVPTGTLWKDVITDNRDARVLTDSAGQTVLIYSFLDNTTLIITDNEATFQTIAGRLDSQKLSR